MTLGSTQGSPKYQTPSKMMIDNNHRKTGSELLGTPKIFGGISGSNAFLGPIMGEGMFGQLAGHDGVIGNICSSKNFDRGNQGGSRMSIRSGGSVEGSGS